jgi:hypothetical protein
VTSSRRAPSIAAPARAALDASAPTRIGHRYTVLEQLGRGGTAIVYRVRDESRGEELALKQLTAQASGRDRALRAQFEREYCVLTQLSHPSVIAVRDFGIDAAGPFYTMELLESGDLGARAPLPCLEACWLMMQVCSALSLLHSRRLIHCDVSPRNVRCSADGSAKLIDFGAMVPMGPSRQVAGTPGFVAPEVVHRLSLDARTDLFSLGATLYHALTGSRPFAARTLAELRDVWQTEPVPLAELVPGIPSALDTLVSSLLRVDPARRPSSAFEVLQRLAAIAGEPIAESALIARAYLSTPVLVGRDTLQWRFHSSLERAQLAHGGGLLFEGASGLGRTRLLDSCVLEAKTSGAIVLHLAGRAAAVAAFSSAHRLAEQLLENLPELARSCALETAVPPVLFAAAASGQLPTLRSIASFAEQPEATQAALQAWLKRISQTQLLVIAVDDIERIDESSLALLVALVHEASSAQLLIVSSALSPIDEIARPALGVLKARCSALTLAPFSAAETDALFASVFSGVAHASLVSDRIHKLALGNPREAMALAQHMLERELIRYADGNWVLPAELAVGDLPASTEDSLRRRLLELPELPRRLAEAQALALEGPWTRADYGALAADSSAERVDGALTCLLRQGVIVESAGAFTLSHLGVRACLIAQLTAAARLEHERTLAEWCARTGRPDLVEVYHWLQAERFEAGLERLSQLLQGSPTVTTLRENSGIELKIIGRILERARAASRSGGRKPREAHELAALLLGLSVASDAQFYHRHASDWLKQLELDSGLGDYRAAEPSVPGADRLQRALRSAATRYTSTSPDERVYSVEEALKQLAFYVATSIAIGIRTLDSGLLATLPGLLEPFARLSPLLHVLWQNAIAATEQNYKGQFEQARLRGLDVYQQLRQVSARELPYVDALRHAVAHGIAVIEVQIGYESAEHWLSIVEEDPLQRVSAQYMRRILCLLDADTEGAERCRKQAEILTVAARMRQMFQPQLRAELHAQIYARDLMGVKHTADRIAQLAAEYPSWRAHHHLAQGAFQWLRGDLHAAKEALERALALANPEQSDPPPILMSWAPAAAAYVSVLAELGQLEEARAFGLRACATCDALGITGFDAHVRALALVEAKLGDYALAVERLDRLIARRVHLRPAARALDLEARALVAIWAKDAADAAHFIHLATQVDAAVGGGRMLARRGRLLDEAQRAGVDVEMPPSDFESKVLGSARPAPGAGASDPRLASINALPEPSLRAARALEMLAGVAGATAGHLYYRHPSDLVRAASLAAAPQPALDAFSRGYLRQQLDEAGMTSVFTALPGAAEARFATWTDRAGMVYRIALLHQGDATTCIGLIALCDARETAMSAEFRSLASALSARLLELGDVARSDAG